MQPDHHHDEGADGPDEAAEQAWRAIVENYGDRADLDEAPAAPPTPPAVPPAVPPVGPESTAPFGGRFGDPRMFRADEQPADAGVDPGLDPEEEGYVPPPPPPLPLITPDRGLAWAGVLGSPIVLLVALILSISIPSWLGYLLIGGFVGGFVYLVVKMPREPRDPWDDGAQV